MRSLNEAWIMKNTTDYVYDDELVWVQVMKHKYNMHGNNAMGQMFVTGRAIRRSLPLVHRQSIKTILNGEDTNFWKDNWIPTIGTLVEGHVEYIPSELEDC